jgi:hypothetical protein
MKTLKFTPILCELISKNEKVSTWRVADEKNLQSGDVVDFYNQYTGELFGKGLLTDVKVTTFGALVPEDWVGHETFTSAEAMYQTYRGYYGPELGPHTELKIITFTFTPGKQ